MDADKCPRCDRRKPTEEELAAVGTYTVDEWHDLTNPLSAICWAIDDDNEGDHIGCTYDWRARCLAAEAVLAKIESVGPDHYVVQCGAAWVAWAKQQVEKEG